jgi:type IV secretory pathway VirB2 component (pilin)
MALLALCALLIAAFAGLAAGRWRALLPVVPAVPLCAFLAGPVAGVLAVLAAIGMGAGVRLHRVIADDSAPRAA